MFEQGVAVYRRLKILILSSQWPGLSPGGGIARPVSELAKYLTEAGHSVSVALVRTGNQLSKREKKAWPGIDIVQLNRSTVPEVFPWFLQDQTEVADLVWRIQPDVVIAQEWQGLGSVLSIESPRPPLITWCHGGSVYDHDGNNSYFSDAFQVVDAELERIQIENSDLIVSPSRFLLGMYESRYGYSIAKMKSVPLHFPRSIVAIPGEAPDDVTLLFVGRLTRRKGVEQFLQLVHLAQFQIPHLNVLIAGESIDYDGRKIVTDLSRLGIKASYLGLLEPKKLWRIAIARNAILTVTSSLDNSPNTVYEAVSAGLKTLIVGDRNGGSELSEISPLVRSFENLESIIWDEVVKETVAGQPQRSIEAINDAITQEWCDLVEQVAGSHISSSKNSEQLNKSTDSVTVVIPTRNRPNSLKDCLSSVNSQTFLPSEVIVVDDASSSNYAYQVAESSEWKFPVRVMTNQKKRGPGFSRNVGAKEAKSRYLAFLDDDNLLLPEHLEMSIIAIRSGADVAVASLISEKSLAKSSPSRTARRVVFLGDVGTKLSYGINLVGDTSFLCRSDDFLRSGGFPEGLEFAAEDLLYLSKMAIGGRKIRLLPSPTVRYRESRTGLNSRMTGNFETQFRLDHLNGNTGFLPSFAARRSIAAPASASKRGTLTRIIKQMFRNHPRAYGLIAPWYRRVRQRML